MRQPNVQRRLLLTLSAGLILSSISISGMNTTHDGAESQALSWQSVINFVDKKPCRYAIFSLGALTSWVRYRTYDEITKYAPKNLQSILLEYKNLLSTCGFGGNGEKKPKILAGGINPADAPDGETFMQQAKELGYEVEDQRVPTEDSIDLRFWDNKDALNWALLLPLLYQVWYDVNEYLPFPVHPKNAA